MVSEDTNRLAVDEISITQIIDDIKRQWKVVVGTALLLVGLAVLYTVARTDMYRYTMNIEIGQKPRPGLSESANFILVPPLQLTLPAFEPVHVVTARLQDAWLPQSVSETMEEDGKLVFVPEFEISNPEDRQNRDTLLVKVTTLASDAYHQEIVQALSGAGAKLLSDHAAFLEKRAQVRIRYRDRLESRRDNLRGRLERETGRVRSLQRMIDGYQDSALAAAVELSTVLPERVKIEKELQEVNGSINKLAHEVDVLRSAVREFDVSYLDRDVMQRQRLAAADVMESLEVTPTRVLNLPTRSNSPVEVEARIIVLLGFVLGVGAGLVLALIVAVTKRERAQSGK